MDLLEKHHSGKVQISTGADHHGYGLILGEFNTEGNDRGGGVPRVIIPLAAFGSSRGRLWQHTVQLHIIPCGHASSVGPACKGRVAPADVRTTYVARIP